jgi:hypothetical protein
VVVVEVEVGVVLAEVVVVEVEVGVVLAEVVVVVEAEVARQEVEEGEVGVVHQVVVEEEEVEEEATILLDPVVEAEVRDKLAPLNPLSTRMSIASNYVWQSN